MKGPVVDRCSWQSNHPAGTSYFLRFVVVVDQIESPSLSTNVLARCSVVVYSSRIYRESEGEAGGGYSIYSISRWTVMQLRGVQAGKKSEMRVESSKRGESSSVRSHQLGTTIICTGMPRSTSFRGNSRHTVLEYVPALADIVVAPSSYLPAVRFFSLFTD